jgi:hypothetical protein
MCVRANQAVRQNEVIDPNIHSCGTVPPHGAEELKHAESGFFTVGMKSYGRAPTFLTVTGYEQVRSVVAAIVGDWESARNVELMLPETGVCSTDASNGSAGCGASESELSSPAPASEAELLQAGVGVATVDALPVVQSSACCSPVAQTACCEASAKEACCGTTEITDSATCGCQ